MVCPFGNSSSHWDPRVSIPLHWWRSMVFIHSFAISSPKILNWLVRSKNVPQITLLRLAAHQILFFLIIIILRAHRIHCQRFCCGWRLRRALVRGEVRHRGRRPVGRIRLGLRARRSWLSAHPAGRAMLLRRQSGGNSLLRVQRLLHKAWIRSQHLRFLRHRSTNFAQPK